MTAPTAGIYTPTSSGGAWSQQLNTLAFGDYTMTLNGSDAAGNAAIESTAQLFIVEEIEAQANSLFRPAFSPTCKAVFKNLFR